MQKMMSPIVMFSVFVNGAVIMVLELLAVRVLAPYVGTTIEVWSATIGIMLAALSIGYYIGGMIADRRQSMSTLSTLFFLGAVFVFLIAPLKSALLPYLAGITYYGVGALLGACALFFIPSFVLGMITVYAIRRETKDVDRVGKTNGTLYALSTIGSILGVFLTGLYLVPLYHISDILYGASSVLLAMAGVCAVTYTLQRVLRARA